MSQAETSTTLNLGVGGDKLDESQVLQADGTTLVKRARVELGFEADDARDRLVSSHHPLPTFDLRAVKALEQIAADVRELKTILLQFIED